VGRVRQTSTSRPKVFGRGADVPGPGRTPNQAQPKLGSVQGAPAPAPRPDTYTPIHAASTPTQTPPGLVPSARQGTPTFPRPTGVHSDTNATGTCILSQIGDSHLSTSHWRPLRHERHRDLHPQPDRGLPPFHVPLASTTTRTPPGLASPARQGTPTFPRPTGFHSDMDVTGTCTRSGLEVCMSE
jgi:hypothetical protein